MTRGTVLFDVGGTLLRPDPVPWPELERRAWGAVREVLCSRAPVLPWLQPGEFTEAGPARLWEALEPLHARDRDIRFATALNWIYPKLLAESSEAEWNGPPPFLAADLLELAEATFHRELASGRTAVPGAADALASLRRAGLRVVAVSNTIFPGPLERGLLEREGLMDLLEGVVCSCDVRRRKPAARPFRVGLRLVGGRPRQTWMVGDSYPADVLGALALGIRAAWLCPVSDAGAQELPAGAHAVPSLAAACDLILGQLV